MIYLLFITLFTFYTMFFFQGGDEIVSKKLRAGVVANALR